MATVTTAMKKFDLKRGYCIEEIASFLSTKCETPPPNLDDFSAIYAIKNQSGRVLYIGKSDSYFEAIGRVGAHMQMKKCVFLYAIALVPTHWVDQLVEDLIKKFKPQYNQQINPRVPNLVELVETVIRDIESPFTLSRVMVLLSVLEPRRVFKQESVMSAMSKIKRQKQLFFTSQRQSGPNRFSVYEKMK